MAQDFGLLLFPVDLRRLRHRRDGKQRDRCSSAGTTKTIEFVRHRALLRANFAFRA